MYNTNSTVILSIENWLFPGLQYTYNTFLCNNANITTVCNYIKNLNTASLITLQHQRRFQPEPRASWRRSRIKVNKAGSSSNRAYHACRVPRWPPRDATNSNMTKAPRQVQESQTWNINIDIKPRDVAVICKCCVYEYCFAGDIT